MCVLRNISCNFVILENPNKCLATRNIATRHNTKSKSNKLYAMMHAVVSDSDSNNILNCGQYISKWLKKS